MPEYALTLCESPHKIKGLRGRDPGLRHTCTLLPTHLGGLVEEHMRADGYVLGVRAPIRQTKHLITFLPWLGALRTPATASEFRSRVLTAERDNHAGELHP